MARHSDAPPARSAGRRRRERQKPESTGQRLCGLPVDWKGCLAYVAVAIVSIVGTWAALASNKQPFLNLDLHSKGEKVSAEGELPVASPTGTPGHFLPSRSKSTSPLNAPAPPPRADTSTASPTLSSQGAAMQVTEGSGRLGNNLAFILRGLMFAKLTQHDTVNLNFNSKSVKEIFDPNVALSLRSSKLDDRVRFCPEKSDKRQEGKPVYNYQGERCRSVSASDFRAVAQGHLKQAFTSEFKDCLDSGSAPEAAAKELTIHLRGQDLWGMKEYELQSDAPIDMEAPAHHWLWHQPPCTMYRKIIVEGGYKKLIVITSPDLRHVCIEWLKSQSASLGVEVLVQAASLREDFCALTRATNLVLSFSTLGDNAALLNPRLQKLYFREFAQEHSLLDCGLWPETELYQYSMPIGEGNHKPFGNTYAEIIRWFTTYDEASITKHTGCKDKSR